MRSTPLTDFTGKLDKAAVALSGLCLVHCLLLPLVIALFPVFGERLLPHETFHQLILIVVVPTTVIALGLGVWRHRCPRVAGLGLAGIMLLAAAAFIVHTLAGESLERWVTVAGGLLLASAHWRNYRLSRTLHTHRPVSCRVGADG